MTYEELLALSMKLTRQNKLMKAQYQKNQSKLAAAATSDAIYKRYEAFWSTSWGSMWLALKEKYRILSELKQKEEHKPQVPVESVNLLDLSPIATDKTPGKYEEIDLLGDAQVDEAMQQVERMREQLRQGALQTQELEKKLLERDEQHEKLDDKLEEMKKEKVATRDEEQEELQRLMELKGELEKKMREMSEQLDAGVKQRENEQKDAADSLATVEQEKKELVERLQQAEAAASERELENDEKEKMEAVLEAQRAEVEAAKADTARLQEQLQALQAASVALNGSSSEDDEGESGSSTGGTAIRAGDGKAESARLQEQIEALQQAAPSLPESSEDDVEEKDEIEALKQAAASSASEAQTEAAEEVANSLRAEVDRLQDLLDAKDSDKGNGKEEEAALMQELERVKLESAERVHEIQSLQKKLLAAEDRLSKAKGESEATQSLVKALKEDTSRLADQVAQFELKQAASEKEITALSEAKRELEEQQEQAREAKASLEKQLEEERTYWTSKLENLITDKLREKEKQVTKMSASQKSMTSELMELQKQVSSMRLEAHATKAEENERRYIQSEKEATDLKKQLDEMREKHHENFEMLAKKRKGTGAYELQARCKTLTRELETARKHEEELEASLSDKTLQVDNLSVDLAETKKSLSDRMALATRLQTENMSMAGKLAEQEHLRDAANSKAAQQTMETQVQAAKADVQRMKQSETQAKQDLESVQRELLKQEESFQHERVEAKLRLQAAVENEQQNFKRELDRLEAESKHNGAGKEKEIARLSARLHELEEDVRSGGADNRKILEFAQLQAKREVEQREQAAQMQALSQQLEEAQREIQELREDKRRHAEELTAMLQNQRRDGVNMEYLKNVVVQYMSFRPGSSQQARLVPVLTTLLQFTAADIKEIKHAARRGNSWTSWGSTDAGLDYKPIVVGAGHRHPMAPPSSQDNSGRRSPLGRMSSAPSSRASSFFLPNGGNDGPVDPSAESADF
ncbi:GRIP protein [Phytophthora cactorum]|nr:GRIP protein [Phytophthora cactorum]